MATSTVTSKGQITIPKEIRDRLRLRTGHRVEFHVDSQGQVILKPRTVDILELKGLLRSTRKRPATLAEMDDAIAQAVCESFSKP